LGSALKQLAVYGQTSISNGNDFANVSSRIQRNLGWKRKEINVSIVKDILLRQKKNIQSLAFAMNVFKSTLHRSIKEGKFYHPSSALKPLFIEANKESQLQYTLSIIESSSLNIEFPTFKGSFDRVHIDEKWFYLTEESIADATFRQNREQDEEETLNTNGNRTGLEGIPPTMTTIESEVLEQGLDY